MKLSDEASYRLGNCKELPDHDEAFIVSGIQALEAGLKDAKHDMQVERDCATMYSKQLQQAQAENEALALRNADITIDRKNLKAERDALVEYMKWHTNDTWLKIPESTRKEIDDEGT